MAEHRDGKRHTNADAISRRPVKHHGRCPSCTVNYVAQSSLGEDTKGRWASAQLFDIDTAFIYERVRSGDLKPVRQEMVSYSVLAKYLLSLWDLLRVLDGILVFQFGLNYSTSRCYPINGAYVNDYTEYKTGSYRSQQVGQKP